MIMLLFDILNENYCDNTLHYENGNNVAFQIKEYIDAGQGINATLDEYEKQFSYSKYYIEKQFRKEFGTSVIAYQNAKRMTLALSLLKDKSVSAVSDELGFGSIYSFSRAFKRYYGTAPNNFYKE